MALSNSRIGSMTKSWEIGKMINDHFLRLQNKVLRGSSVHKSGFGISIGATYIPIWDSGNGVILSVLGIPNIAVTHLATFFSSKNVIFIHFFLIYVLLAKFWNLAIFQMKSLYSKGRVGSNAIISKSYPTPKNKKKS